MEKISTEWVDELQRQERLSYRETMDAVYLIQDAINNTNELSWLGFNIVKQFGYPSGVLLQDGSGKYILHNLIEYKSKYYYIPNENTPTDLHS